MEPLNIRVWILVGGVSIPPNPSLELASRVKSGLRRLTLSYQDSWSGSLVFFFNRLDQYLATVGYSCSQPSRCSPRRPSLVAWSPTFPVRCKVARLIATAALPSLRPLGGLSRSRPKHFVRHDRLGKGRFERRHILMSDSDSVQ